MRIRYFVLPCLLIYSILVDAQRISPGLSAVNEKVKTSLLGYYKKFPEEKLFLHTDQNFYLTGQTIWYKAYSLAYGKPSQLSKIVYVCLTDSSGRKIKQDKLPLKNGVAHGDIILNGNLTTGWYNLQAYTAWMLNFDCCFYRQKIYIRNVKETSAENKPHFSVQKYRISFFPEGGDLLDGNICKVAFQATDNNGLPAKIYAELFINDKRSAIRIATQHDGMGSFELATSAAQHYKVIVHFPDSSRQTVTLPAVKSTGICMRVSSIQANLIPLKIAFSGKQISQDIILVAMQSNGLSAAYPVMLSRGINLINLPKSDFATGILRLTVLNDEGIPLAERIVFVNNADQLQLSLIEDSLSFLPKSKNAFSLKLTDQFQKPVKGNLSVSITDADLSTETEESIWSGFLMSSELKGAVYHPQYYFKNNSDSLQKQLDLVMLTNGWRHFKWEKILDAQPEVLKYTPEQAQFIVGKVENYQQKNNLKLKLTVINADSTVKYYGLDPDSSGRFIINDYEKQGAAKLIFEAFNLKNKSQPVKVSFAGAVVDTVNFSAEPPDTLTETKPVIRKSFLDSLNAEQRLQLIKNGILLKEVTVKSQKLSMVEEVVKNHVQQFEVDRAYDLDLVHTFAPPTVNIIEYIKGRFPGLQIIGGYADTARFIYRGASSFLDPKQQPYFYIDEARVEYDDIRNLTLTNVALIRFAPPPVVFAPLMGGNQCALLVYTKNYKDAGSAAKKSTPPLSYYTFNGYNISREFPVPDYRNPNQTKQSDLRTTLLWNYDLDTDENGLVKISFYNSDKAKKYRIIVQGMDAEGRMCYLEQEIYPKIP